MKINFDTYSYIDKSFSGEVAEPQYANSYFSLTPDDFIMLDREDAGGAVKLNITIGSQNFWAWFSPDGLNMAELAIASQLDLRGLTAAEIAMRDTIVGGVLIIKTPTKTHQIYMTDKSRGSSYRGDALTFTEQGQYQVMFLLPTWYRLSAITQLGKTEYQYHKFSYEFSINSDGAKNTLDNSTLEIDQVFRLDHRSGGVEIQKRCDDFYYFTDCDIETMTLAFTTTLGVKFYDVTFSYKGGTRITEQFREDFAPNHEVTPA